MDRRQQGTAAEDRALDYLTARGLRLVCRNFLCKVGELDLVLIDRQTLVVVEVRLRENQSFGSAADSIGPRKRRRIVRATQCLLIKHPELRRWPIRFDVVVFDSFAAADHEEMQWLRAAFEADWS